MKKILAVLSAALAGTGMVLGGGVLAASIVLGSQPAQAASPGAYDVGVYLTMYGWPDNSPPGAAIAYPKSDGYPTLHDEASGSGTYSDPLTVAVAKGYLKPGTRVYISAYHKYGMVEDECATCTGNWIDVWVGGKGIPAAQVLAAEDKLTIDRANVTVNPVTGLATDVTPMLTLAGVTPPTPTPKPPALAKPRIARTEVHGSTVIFLWKQVQGASYYENAVLYKGAWQHHGTSAEEWAVGYYRPHVQREFRVRACDASGCGSWATVNFTG